MEINLLLAALAMVGVSMYVIKFACDSFEGASDYLGTKVYKMAPGVRGASLEAIASSMPELFTTLFLLFFFHDRDGFSAGIATCAGSALFNGAIIPALCILAVTLKGVKGQPVDHISLLRSTLVRDGLFFLAAEILLIYFLGSSTMYWWMGLVLMLVYAAYATILIRGVGAEGSEAEDEEEEDPDEAPETSRFVSFVTFDMNALIYNNQPFTKASAWVVLSASTAVIAVACYVLAEAVMLSAEALHVAPYFTAVILGAAASSVPDTYISYKDALKGDYDDAVANAIGSNIFDICVALGLPLLLYGLIYGDLSLARSTEGQAEIQSLRVLLLISTVALLAIFFVTKTGRDLRDRALHYVGTTQAVLLLLLYGAWTTIIVSQAFGWWPTSWSLAPLAQWISGSLGH